MNRRKFRATLLLLFSSLLVLTEILIFMQPLSWTSSIVLAQEDHRPVSNTGIHNYNCSGNADNCLHGGANAFQNDVSREIPSKQIVYTNTIFLPLVMKPKHPLFVGLQLQWDGNGYVRGSEYQNIGTHLQIQCNRMTDADTIECYNYFWNDPNPYLWNPTSWNEYYSVTTGLFNSASVPGDPAWKWGRPWIVPYNIQFSNGQTIYVGGQAFAVSGPYSGYTAFGQSVKYWKLVNKETFLYWDSGGDWKQYVHSGDITLWYSADSSKLLLHDKIKQLSFCKISIL